MIYYYLWINVNTLVSTWTRRGRNCDHLVTLRGNWQGYFSERPLRDQHGSNPGCVHEWRGSPIFYLCTTFPSLNLYIESLGSMDEFCMSSVLIFWPNQLIIIPALRWQLFLSKNPEWEVFTYMSYTLWEPTTCQWETRPAFYKMCGKWNIACSFLSDVLVRLHQGLLLSSANIDANKTAVVPDIVKMHSVADDSCTNATVGYITSKSDSVACVIVNNSRPFWNLKIVDMLIYKSKSLNLNLNLIVFSMNQAIECLL